VLTHPSARLTCVVRFGDPVLGLRFDHNLRVTGSRDRVIRLEGPSTDVLPTLPAGGFSAVYLDGSHRGPDFQDAINGWRLLQSGGVLLFDGYYWERLPSDVLGSKAEMERFLEMIEGQGEVLLREYQLAVRKA
jgi:hypothetical protein